MSNDPHALCRRAARPRLFRFAVPLILAAFTLVASVASFTRPVSAQPSATAAAEPVPGPLTPPTNGPRRLNPTSRTGLGQGRQLLTGATLHTAPGAEPIVADLLISDGLIESITPVPEKDPGAAPAAATGAVSAKAQQRPGVQTRDLSGMHVYAGFIDAFVEVDVPRPDINAPGAHWNAMVTPQRRVLDAARSVNGSWGNPPIDDGTAGTLRSMGFVAAALSPARGIFRGSSAVVSLAQPRPDPSSGTPPVYRADAYQAVGFDQASESGDPNDFRWNQYPNSQMGVIALIRQTLLDTDWIATSTNNPSVAPGCLEFLIDRRSAASRTLEQRPHMDNGLLNIPAGPTLWFDTSDELEVLRADSIAREFHRPLVIVGSGREFRRIDAIAAAKRSLVVPLGFNQRPKVDTLGYADATPLEDLMMWEQSPTNPRRFAQAGVEFALTTSKIPDKAGGRAAFSARLSQAIKHGLSAPAALAALTTTPARLLGVDRELGTIEVGKRASLLVADKPLFMDQPDPEPGSKSPRIMEVWIDGERHELIKRPSVDLAGTWTLEFTPAPASPFKAEWVIDDQEPPGITIRKTPIPAAGAGDGKAPAETPAPASLTSVARQVQLVENRLSFIFDHTPLGEPGVFTNAATIEPDASGLLVIHGELTRSGGERTTFVARRTRQHDDSEPDLIGTWKPVIPTGVPGKVDPKALEMAGLEIIIEKDPAANADPKATVIRARRPGTPERHYALAATSAEPTPETPDRSKPAAGAEHMAGSVVRYTLVAPEVTPEGGAPLSAQSLYVTLRLPADPDEPIRAFASFDSAEGQSGKGVEIARERPTPERDDIAAIPEDLPLPFGPFGRMGAAARAQAGTRLPPQQNLILSNCTIWTCNEKDEVIENGAVVLSGGKITYAGPSASMPRLAGEYQTLDLRGMHVTPGLIDAHSHTGISKGVNEGGQAVTAEVRIGDVTDPDSISWYRQLAGGVTSVNSMHGSANPIGGQTQTNKIRWGVSNPNEMHFEGAKPGIKFALGENVKQSNWGDGFKTRYPQSRMGVETLIRDRFVAAKEYAAAPSSLRPDLELAALAEILRGERLIHCHSYRQDEILMLCRIADEFGFKIGTFQHGLECYKVAREVKDHARGASIFTDWWAYKVEVQDAIPYAGPILMDQGVRVSFNSDSDELARRLNHEAAKAVRYSGGPFDRDNAPTSATVSAASALRTVTINPAYQLGIEARVGSIEPGKDADLAVWTHAPTSVYARCEKTLVDGRVMWDHDQDLADRDSIARERARLIQKILAQEARERGTPLATPKPASTPESDSSGDPKPGLSAPADDREGSRRSLLEQMRQRAADARREQYLSVIRRGLDPRFGRCDQCDR